MKKGHQSRGQESLDQLVDWLRAKRRNDLSGSLGSLLAGRPVNQEYLIDLACLDLIERRRSGYSATAEEYFAELQDLECEAPALDLIDAEICISRELGQPVDLQPYLNRFPQLAIPIRELLELNLDAPPHSNPSAHAATAPRADGGQQNDEERLEESLSPGLPIRHETTIDGDSFDPSTSFTVELAVPGDDRSGDPLPTVGGHRLNAPEWFMADSCLASGEGRWLIRGRDSVRGLVMAMKVVQLPSQVNVDDSIEVLNLSEAASKVSHPMWVCPLVAAVQHQHLSVIRPWVFATPWLAALSSRRVSAQIQEFASISYCLEAAHQCGATHGAFHPQNVLLDHDGKVHIVDAISNRTGLARWFENRRGHSARHSNLTLDRRKQEDIQAFVRLVASVASSWDEPWTGQFVNELVSLQEGDPDGAAERVGQRLLEFADSPPRHSDPSAKPWYRGPSRWFGKRS